MPFFYKLSDLYKVDRYNNRRINEDWLDAVIFTVNDFYKPCNKKNHEKGVVFLIFNLSGYDVKKKNFTHGRSKNLTEYEYYVNNEITPDKQRIYDYDDDPDAIDMMTFNLIVKKEDEDRTLIKSNVDKVITLLEKLYSKYSKEKIIDTAYIHITCYGYTESIFEKGLYSQAQINSTEEMQKLRIGDREDEAGDKRGRDDDDDDDDKRVKIGGKSRRKSMRKKRKQKKRRSVRKLSKK